MATIALTLLAVPVSTVLAAPAPGGSCTTEGRVRTTKAGVLRCQKSGPRLRWVLTATTTTTTTVPPSTTTSTLPLSCAAGGTCVVGDTGPGGGIVFYVASSNFSSTGSDCGSDCRYLEFAPRAGESFRVWALPWAVTGAVATAIGSGYQNTIMISTQAGNVETNSAAVYAFNYSNNGKTDWHLPSKDELNELCKYARRQTTGDTSTKCTGSASLSLLSSQGGFAVDGYWSSSEYGGPFRQFYPPGLHAWKQGFSTGEQSIAEKDNSLRRVRPVRAF